MSNENTITTTQLEPLKFLDLTGLKRYNQDLMNYLAENGNYDLTVKDLSVLGELVVKKLVTEETETIQIKEGLIILNPDNETTKASTIGTIYQVGDDTYGIVYDPIQKAICLGLGTYNENGFTFNANEGEPVATRNLSDADDKYGIIWDKDKYHLKKAEKMIIGKNANTNTSAAFAIGNGYLESSKYNSLEIGYSGDIRSADGFTGGYLYDSSTNIFTATIQLSKNGSISAGKIYPIDKSNQQTIAAGDCSIAIGASVLVNAQFAAGFGYATEVNGNTQFVIGKYNIIEESNKNPKNVFIIGNGGKAGRSNALEISVDGDFVSRAHGANVNNTAVFTIGGLSSATKKNIFEIRNSGTKKLYTEFINDKVDGANGLSSVIIGGIVPSTNAILTIAGNNDAKAFEVFANGSAKLNDKEVATKEYVDGQIEPYEIKSANTQDFKLENGVLSLNENLSYVREYLNPDIVDALLNIQQTQFEDEEIALLKKFLATIKESN